MRTYFLASLHILTGTVERSCRRAGDEWWKWATTPKAKHTSCFQQKTVVVGNRIKRKVVQNKKNNSLTTSIRALYVSLVAVDALALALALSDAVCAAPPPGGR